MKLHIGLHDLQNLRTISKKAPFLLVSKQSTLSPANKGIKNFTSQINLNFYLALAIENLTATKVRSS